MLPFAFRFPNILAFASGRKPTAKPTYLHPFLQSLPAFPIPSCNKHVGGICDRSLEGKQKRLNCVESLSGSHPSQVTFFAFLFPHGSPAVNDLQ